MEDFGPAEASNLSRDVRKAAQAFSRSMTEKQRAKAKALRHAAAAEALAAPV